MKAINTLNIELTQQEARVEALITQNKGHQDIIDSNNKLIEEYQVAINDLKEALNMLTDKKAEDVICKKINSLATDTF